MRWWMALITIALTGALAFGSVRLISLHKPEYAATLLYFWLAAAALSLLGLIWLYVMIAIGPRVTVTEGTARRLERGLARVRADRKLSRDRRISREYRLARQAARLNEKIDPATEAQNVFQRRVRLANSVMALICVLTAAFTIFAELAPQVWPEQNWYVDAQGPDTYHAVLFSVDQVLRGTLFDLFDVFDWRISSAENNPDNVYFSSFIVIYRFLMGGALIAAVAVRLGMHEDWHETSAHEGAEKMKARLARLAGDQHGSTGPAVMAE